MKNCSRKWLVLSLSLFTGLTVLVTGQETSAQENRAATDNGPMRHSVISPTQRAVEARQAAEKEKAEQRLRRSNLHHRQRNGIRAGLGWAFGVRQIPPSPYFLQRNGSSNSNPRGQVNSLPRRDEAEGSQSLNASSPPPRTVESQTVKNESSSRPNKGRDNVKSVRVLNPYYKLKKDDQHE